MQSQYDWRPLEVMFALLLMLSIGGCGAMNPRKICDEELANVRAELQKTLILAQNEQAELDAQGRQLQSMKTLHNETAQTQKVEMQEHFVTEQAILEQERKQLEQERFEINRMRELNEHLADE